LARGEACFWQQIPYLHFLINNQIYKIISDANLSNLTTIQMQTHNTAPKDENSALIGKLMLAFSNVKVFLVNDFKRFR